MYQRKILATVRKVLPAVVSIVSKKHLEGFEKNPHRVLYSLLPGRSEAKRAKDSGEEVNVGSGSGCIVDKSGLILTNKHVLGDAETEYSVVLNDGRKFPAKILSIDSINDVAVLKINAGNLPTVALGDARRAELGESVLAMGNALGVFKNTVSLGIVSGLSRSVSAKENPNGPAHEMRGLIQTDAAINPGNSGGPLVNLKGQAVGINVAVVSGAHSIGFAIPINAARRDLADIKKYGRIRRPYLGLRYLLVDEVIKNHLNLPMDYGAIVVAEERGQAVIKGSPAEKAGIKERDVILECNGKKISAENVLEDYLNTMRAGEVLSLLVWRNGKKAALKITLAER